MPCTSHVVLTVLFAQKLRAQSLYQRGDSEPGSDLRTDGSASEELPDLSELIKSHGSLELEGREAQLAEKLRSGAKMTPERWSQIGPEPTQALKVEFQKNGRVKRVVEKRCGTERLECTLKQLDSLMYPAVEIAAAEGKFGDLAVLGSMVKSTLASSWFYGVDWYARAALIAKWRDPEWLAEDSSSDAFNTMKAEISSSTKLKELVGLTCDALDSVRPNCRQFAPRALFSQALANAAAGLKSSKTVVPMLEEALRSRGAVNAASSSAGKHSASPFAPAMPVAAPAMPAAAPAMAAPQLDDDEFDEKLKAEVEAKARAAAGAWRPGPSGQPTMSEDQYLEKSAKAEMEAKARAAAASRRQGSSGLLTMSEDQYLEKSAKAKKHAEMDVEAKKAAQARARAS